MSAPPLVLDVDDRPAEQAACSLRLRGAGYQVAEAASPEQALAAAGERHPAVIVLGGRFACGGEQGALLRAALAETPTLAHVPVVHCCEAADEASAPPRAGDGPAPTLCVAPDSLLGFVAALARAHAAEDAAAAALQELRTSEARFRASFENAAVGIAHVALDGRWLRVNAKLCEILGYAREELLGRSFQEITHPHDLAAELALARRLAAGEISSYSLEKRYLRPDGSSTRARLTGSLLRDEQGRPREFIAVVADAREQHQAQERMLATEALLRLFIEHAPAALAMFDREMRYLAVSRRWLDALRVEGDVLGRSHYDVFPEIPERWKEAHRRGLAGELLRADDDPFPRADGSLQWIKWEVRPWLDDHGEVGGILIAFEDVTGRNEASAALRESKQRLQGIVDSAMDAVVSIDDEQRIVLFNPAAERMFGCPAAEALGSRIERFIPPAAREEHAAQVRAFGEAKPASRAMGRLGSLSALRADGTTFPIEASISRVRLDGQRVYTAIVRDVTERQRAEQALRASEARYRLLFETMVHGTVHQDRTGAIIAMNPAAERILGKTREEFLGLTSEAVEHDTLREDGTPFPGAEHPSMLALRTGQSVKGVLMQVWNPRQGEYRLISIDAVPLYQAGSAEPYEVYTTFEDVTERHAATEALRESEQRLRLAMCTARMFAFHWDTGSDVVIRSPDCGPILGLDGDTAVRDTGAGFFAKVHPEDRPRLAAAIAALSPEQPDYTVTYRCLRPGLEPVVLEERAHGLFDGHGRLARLTGMSADASERERRLHQLRESEQRFRDLANSMPQLVWTARADGAVDYQNSRAAEYLSATSEQGAPSWLDAVHPEDVAQLSRAWQAALAAGTPLEAEHRMQLSDGSWRWHLSRAVPVGHPEGPLRWFGTATDIHDRKQAEQSLQEADRRKDEFIALLGHELRNPLAPIRNAAQLMKLAPGDHDVLERARQMVERQVGHMTRLIDDLLDVSRISRGGISLKRARVDLAAIVETAAADIESSAASAGLQLACDAQGPVWVHGDEPRLRQVVTNLLHNAIKFTDPGGSVRISLSRRGSEAAIEVADTGQGIAAEVLDMLFVPFSQPAARGERAGGGLGLGLALVKGLVELHGGSVSAQSPGPGRGATFTVLLPTAPAAAVSAGPEPLAAGGRRRRVLIVEDNEDVVSSLHEVLTLLGHEVASALTGREGLRRARELRPDVVLCDLGLPDLSGHDVARALRAEPGTSGALLVAISGYGQEEDRRRAQAAGFDHHLTKPADPAAIERLLQRRG